MENALICNGDKCRKELTTQALVTTCGHIFCLDCGQKFGLVSQDNQICTVCPECNIKLPKKEDVALINTNPSEEYRTCVLSGLSPGIIMECAGRAISFWSYQTANELHYQKSLYTALEGKYSRLRDRLDELNRDASARINGLHDKLDSMMATRDDLQQKNNNLTGAYHEKSRQLQRMQELYDKVKNRAGLGHIEQAAVEAVDRSTRSVPQLSTSNQAFSPFRPRNLNVENERSFPRMQQFENESLWPRKRPQAHEQNTNPLQHPQSASGRLSAEIFRPRVPSNVELPRGNTMRPSAASPSLSQLGNVWAGVGFTSGAKIGQPARHLGEMDR